MFTASSETSISTATMNPNASQFDPARMMGAGGGRHQQQQQQQQQQPQQPQGTMYSSASSGAPPSYDGSNMPYYDPSTVGNISQQHYNNAYGGGSYADYYPPQHQPQYSSSFDYGQGGGGGGGGGGGAVIDECNPYAGAGTGEYYPTEAVMASSASFDSTNVEPGSLYPHKEYPVLHPQVYGAPVTAMAFDPSFTAMYVASATQRMVEHPRAPGQHRASMLVTHQTVDGSLYASVAGHPEASSSVLKQVYASIYGSSSIINHLTLSRSIPSHAYRPPYGYHHQTNTGAGALNHPAAAAAAAGATNYYYQMGIQSLVPLAGYVASVSPSGVRLHATGGLQVADWDIEGMICGTANPNTMHSSTTDANATTTHMTVGGRAILSECDSDKDKNETEYRNKMKRKSILYCVDLYQGLRVVNSASLPHDGSDSSSTATSITCLATSHSKGSIVAGCSDGLLRLFDGRGLRSLAKIKSHAGGVVQVAVSNDGNLVATTGYGSKSPNNSGLFAYPDPTVYIHDIRYLGRGGFPHPFAGVRGGPRFVSFLPDVVDASESQRNRLLVTSGQSGGGMQIMVPFQEANAAKDFLTPHTERNERVTCQCMVDDEGLLALGTSQGRILQYQMAGTAADTKASPQRRADASVLTPGVRNFPSLKSSTSASSPPPPPKRSLVLPSFEAPTPLISMEASLLQTQDPNLRSGANDTVRSIFGTYTLTVDPTVSAVGDPRDESKTSFGPLASKPLVASSRLTISPDLLIKVSQTVDFLQTIPTSDLELDLLEDHRPKKRQSQLRKQPQPKQNPNKLLYSDKLFKVAYNETLNRKSKRKASRSSGGSYGEDDSGDEDDTGLALPTRYSLMLRPTHKSASSFLHSEFNQTGFLPGWDYPPTMPNAFVPPVLLLLYFIPEVRDMAFNSSLSERSIRERTLIPELSMLFHRIENISSFAATFATEGSSKSKFAQVGAWAPYNFISCLSTMPEAEQLQILDGSPEAVEIPRRPEAFYRFLLYQLDKEAERNFSGSRLMDSLSGISFTSVSEFISGSGPPSTSTTRAKTIDLTYDPFLSTAKQSDSSEMPRFGDVLQYNLCREKKLPGWNQQTKSSETILQRKIATSLPSVLTLSCACAGRKESEGLELWRIMRDTVHWLPEMIEVELEENGSVVVRELVVDQRTGVETWEECRKDESIPNSVSELIRNVRDPKGPTKRRYRLDAIVSMVRDDMDRNCPEEVRRDDGQAYGHHVLHVRVPKETKRMLLSRQQKELERALSADRVENLSDMTILGLLTDSSILKQRLEQTKARLEALEQEISSSSWVLVNGFVVNDTVAEDARAFHVKFKEPSLIVFRAVDDADSGESLFKLSTPSQPTMLSLGVMTTLSVSNGAKSPYAINQRPSVLPGAGDLVAFDAEFVSVQDEYGVLSETGSKLTIRETRHAAARVSIINCNNRTIVLDDHILPREPVVDYLTRFSGIVAKDLNPKQSPHHLITPRAAYLKLRFLVERGCVFIGHGLQQDFWIMNLVVPANQIIDTVVIYHKPAQRYISLRFLTNFVLKRDMQQDVHDSVEDAMAAYELYLKAVELKHLGKFDDLLEELYEYGRKTDWKLGLDEDEA